MKSCKMSIYLAYGMLVYVFASIFYLILTFNLGTPFKDSLTPKQIIIKQKSANQRRNIFYGGITLGIITLYITQPFQSC